MTNDQHPRLSQLIAEERSAIPLGVVYPTDAISLSAARQVADLEMAKVFLIGPEKTIREVAEKESISLANMAIVPTSEEAREAAKAATLMTRDKRFAVLMKGSLHTDDLMSAVVSREHGLRTNRRISHVILCDVPTYHKLIALADCVVNLSPDIKQKHDMLVDAIRFLQSIGIAKPKVAIVAAVEVVNPAMPATVDAAELVRLSKLADFPPSIVEGPFGFDNAISAEAARIKGISSQVSGDPDLILLPDIEASNILYKGLIYLANGACAGTITGATVPIVLTSRADTVFSRLASVAVSLRSARHSLVL
jgi:phosphate acetyltransferase